MTGTTYGDERLYVPCSGPSVWSGEELADHREEWTRCLSSHHLAEIDAALREARRRDTTLLKLTTADFPLPTLSAELERIAEALEHGRGFVLVKGLAVGQLTKSTASAVFWGLGQYLGRPVPQNADGHVLGHVRDTGRSLADPATRGYQTRVALPFHTEGADLVALLCLQAPRTDGRTSLVSAGAVHNAVMDRRPDLAERLYRTYCFDRRQEHPPEEPPYEAAPLAVRLPGGALSMRYNRCYLESAQRFPEVPRLEPADSDLFDLIDDVAASAGFRLDIDLQVGDLLLLNTHTIMHARAEFEDHDPPELKRHLLRLWLALPQHPRAGRARHGITPRDVIRRRNAASQAETNSRRLPT
ncbi:TauD/TfdA family dioxygenase [Streptomyces sp. NRRL B-24572]|uniref:TauD/TfdA family dioxygenase n=1 Tax=Streptomyces sp. NRRL B-24572 TaxID=1962156 RepID=UPI0015C52115|nr:TauD/TfdA family dioxygenase [Streptomyces sp. NRRL B-24572]